MVMDWSWVCMVLPHQQTCPVHCTNRRLVRLTGQINKQLGLPAAGQEASELTQPETQLKLRHTHNASQLSGNASQLSGNASQLSGKLHYGLCNVVIIGRQTVVVNYGLVDHQLQLGVDAGQARQAFCFLHELRHAMWAVVICTQVEEGKNVVNEFGKVGGASDDGGDIWVPHATGHGASHCRMRVHHVT